MENGLPQAAQLNRRVVSPRLLARILRVATAVALLLATAPAQNSAPHSEAVRRALLEVQSVNTQPTGPLQAVDVSVGEALDRSVHNDELELWGDASGTRDANPPDEQAMMMFRRRALPNRPGSTQSSSQSVADVTSDNGVVAVPLQPALLPPNTVPDPRLPVTVGSIGGTTRSRTQPWKGPATRQSSVRASRAQAATARLPSRPTAVRSRPILLPASHPKTHTRRPHHRSTAWPFSAFTSLQ